MNILYIGELAAFGTALCWTFGSQFFEAAGKRVGALSVNLIRLIMALIFFFVLMLSFGFSLISYKNFFISFRSGYFF